jgi:peptidyl-tRNA hydrolase, PTH1 family
VAFRASTRSGTPADALVVGLGNPGAEYVGTRHNIGVEVVEALARRANCTLKMSTKERALVAEARFGPTRVVLAFPQTFMNLSGESVTKLVARHGITDVARLIVVHDELDLPPARVKIKLGGGIAGHNGLRSIQAHVGSPDFVRVRIGIGRPPGTQSGADYVLRRVGKAERTELDVAVQIAADAVEAIVGQGVDRAMNDVNTRP